MKKHLQFFGAMMLAVAALPASAQTAESPQVLVVGENVCPQGTTYFTYTATETALMKLDKMYLSTYGESVTGAADGETWKVPQSGEYGEYTLFYVEKGATYTFSHTENYGELKFSVELTPVQGSIWGESCSDPVIMPEDGEFLFPTVDSDDYYTQPPYVYAKYTAPYDGKLKLVAVDRLQTFAFGEGCDGDWTTLDGSYDSSAGGYVFSILLDAGETVFIRVNAYSACVANIMYMEVIPGATCEDAFTAKVGENVIPAAAGEYFYTLATPAEPAYTTMVVSSDAACSMKQFPGCGNENSTSAREYATPNFRRTPVAANSTINFVLTKTTATAADESFDIALNDLLPIENDQVGEPVVIGQEMQTPGATDYFETYYYCITVPEGEKKLLVLESDAPAKDTGAAFRLTALGTTYPALGLGSEFKSEVEGGKQYMLRAEVSEGTPDGYKFKVTLEDMQPGQTQTYTIAAQLGENDVPDFTPVYFSYTSDVDRYVAARTDIAGATVKAFSKSYSSWNEMTTVTTDEGEKFECKANSEYLIEVSGVAAAGKLILTEVPYGPGESAATAIAVEPGTVDLPATPGRVWYKLEAPIDGFFTFNTNLAYDYSNNIVVYVGEVGANNGVTASADYSTYSYKQVKADVAKGQTVYVCISYVTGGENLTATMEFTEPAPGESSSNPIKLDFTAPESKVSFRTASYSSPVWYSIDLPEGIMSLIAGSNLTLDLYNSANPPSIIVSGGWISSSEYGIKRAVIPEAGTYLLCVTSNQTDGLEATVTMRDPQPGESPAMAIPLEITSDPFEFTVESDVTEDTSVWYSFDVHPGDLSIVGGPAKYFNAQLFDGSSLTTPLGEISTELTEESYNYGIRNIVVEKDSKYYFNLLNASQGSVLTFSGSAIAPVSDFVNVNVSVTDGQTFSYSAPKNMKTSFVLVLPENWKVESCTVNGEEAAADLKVDLDVAEADQDVVFTLAYDGELVFIDSTVGMQEIDAVVRVGVVDGKIRIEGTAVGDVVRVFNLGGMQMAYHEANNNAVEIELPAGTYVVTVNGSAAKVVL